MSLPRSFPWGFLIILILLSACGGGAAETPTPMPVTPAARQMPESLPTALPSLTPTPTEMPVQGVLSIWHSWPEADMPALVQIINDFRSLYPDVLFDVLYVPSDTLLARFADETRQRRGPAILLGPAEWGPLLYDEGLIRPAAEFVDDAILANLNQASLGAAQYQGETIALPYAIQGVVLYRNRDILTLNPNTFDELLTLAQSSKQGPVQGAILERSFFYSGGHLLGMGGRLMDEDGLPMFNNTAGVAWLELLKSFEDAGPPDFFSDTDLEAFKAGKAGWIIDGTWRLKELAEALGADKVAIDPWPSYQNGRLAGFLRAENLYLSAAIPPELAPAVRQFTSHFLSAEQQSHLVEVGRIPAAGGVKISDPILGPLYAQAITALAGDVPYPVTASIAIYSINLDIALRAYLEEGMPAGEALRMAQEAILAGLAQAQATPTPLP